jgi:hypothetical protein
LTDVTKLRHWLLIGAGHCDFVPGSDGKPNAIPKSMDFESMDEADFCELQRSIDAFLDFARPGHLVACTRREPALGLHGVFMEGFQR